MVEKAWKHTFLNFLSFYVCFVADEDKGRGREEIKEKLKEEKADDEEEKESKKRQLFKMETDEEDEDDEEVLWCSGCTGGRKGACCNRQRRREGNEEEETDNENTVETETLSGLPHQNNSSSDDGCCTVCPCPFPRSQSLAFENIPMSSVVGATSGTNQEGNRLTAGGDKNPIAAMLRSSGGGGNKMNRVYHRRHPLIPSKTIVVPPTSSSSLENLVQLETKASSIACLNDARILCRDKVLASVPNKMSSTGVRILYLCDANNMPGENDNTGILHIHIHCQQ